MKLPVFCAVFLCLLMPFQLWAGWKITGRYIDKEGNTTYKRYFIQDNIIKVERYNLIYTCNLKTQSIIIVDPVKLVFVKTNLTAYTQKMREIKLKRLNELLLLIPDNQKAEYETQYKKQIEEEIDLSAGRMDSIFITQSKDSSKLLGYNAAKYVISQEKLKKEEFFFTDKVDISSDLDFNAFLQYVYLLEPEDKTTRYLASEQNIDLVKNGLVLRRFIYNSGFRDEWQVNKIDQENIPDYEFGEPDLCKELTLDKFLNRQKSDDEKYYDDFE
jgi:hypothetical protein